MNYLIFLSIVFFILSPQMLYSELITKQLISDADKKYKMFAKNRFIDLNDNILATLKTKNDRQKLLAVNDWMNYIQYKSDKKIYGVSDYWATLYEFVGKGMGDCEDYTIAKYYVLKELGVDPKKMKFTYVVYKDRRGKKISHMVLAYLTVPKPKSKKEILILDNINKRVLPASKRRDIVKVVKMINGDTGAKSKKWKKLEANMKRKKL